MFLVSLISPASSSVGLLCSTDRHKPGSLVPWHLVGLILAQLQPGEPPPPQSWQQDSIRATCSRPVLSERSCAGAPGCQLRVSVGRSLQREGGSTSSLPERAAWREVG